MIVEILISIFLLLGSGLSLLGSFGILRFPDVYGRLHSATKSATLGVIGILTGTFIYFIAVEGVFAGKILLGILFVFLTAPLAGFMISRTAYRMNVKISDRTVQDDLKKYRENPPEK